MSNLFWLSEEQFEKIKPLLPDDVRGVPRVDDRRVLSGIIHVIKRGLHWSDCPAEYGPAKTIYNRYARWGEKGVTLPRFSGHNPVGCKASRSVQNEERKTSIYARV